jgi:autotransporter passenger strand-loop-strand repeat protein
LSGGEQDVGGSATSTTVDSGGLQVVDSGGVATGTTVNAGGTERVDSGGAASATTLRAGEEYVSAGGTVSGVMFGASGTLALESLTGLAGAISGLQTGDVIDFVSTTVTSATISGSTLTVVAGGQTTNYALSGPEAGIAPSVTSDGHGGTELTFAALDHWTSSRGGNWPTASDWSMGAPTSALIADIDAAGTYMVNIASFATAYELLINHATATVADARGGVLTLAGPGGSASPNGALAITAGAFDLDGGALKAGSIAIGSGASFLTSGNSSYTGASALNETITDNGSFALANSLIATVSGNLSGSGQVIVENSAKATFTGAVAGSEQFLIENSASADMASAVSGTGSFSLMSSAQLEFDKADTENVAFAAGGSETLRLGDAAQLSGAIAGFMKPDVIDLLGQKVASLSFSSGVLTLNLSGGTHEALDFSGSYTTASFKFASDGHGGTNILHT